MRLNVRLAALCLILLASQQALAADLPQRWVSAGGALSEWVSALGGESKLVGWTPPASIPNRCGRFPVLAISDSSRRRAC